MWWWLVWVTYCVSECISIIMIAVVCLLTRPRQNGVFSPRYAPNNLRLLQLVFYDNVSRFVSRSYFEGGPFPILNMQQFDHFDELFGDQIWDPDMVFGSGAAALAAAAPPPMNMNECLVIEYPTPSSTDGQTYFPRLAIATLEKQPVAKDEKEEAPTPTLRRRTTNSGSSGASSSTFSTLSNSSDTAITVDVYSDRRNSIPPSFLSTSSSSLLPPSAHRNRSISAGNYFTNPHTTSTTTTTSTTSYNLFDKNHSTEEQQPIMDTDCGELVHIESASSSSSSSPFLEDEKDEGEGGSGGWLYNSSNKNL